MKKNNILFKRLRVGFTLTEILVVVIIIGIVSTLALPMLVKTLEKAKLGEAASNLNLIRTGEKIYFLEYSTFSPTISDLNIEDPSTGAKYFDYSIVSADSDGFSAKADRKDSAPSPYKTYNYFIDKDGTITSDGPLSP